MRLRLEITALETVGNVIRVTGQGNGVQEAEWRPMLRWTFELPIYRGRGYRIGDRLIVTVAKP